MLYEELKKNLNIRYSNYKFQEIWKVIEKPYVKIDEYNILIDENIVLLSPYGDREKKGRWITICCYKIKEREFEIYDIKKGCVQENLKTIKLDRLLDHINFEKEIFGKTPYKYYPEIEAIAIRVKKKTRSKIAKHLWCNQFQYGVWIKNTVFEK